MKYLIVGVFALAVCWGVSRYANIGGTAFAVGPVPVSWAMLLLGGTMVVVSRRVK